MILPELRSSEACDISLMNRSRRLGNASLQLDERIMYMQKSPVEFFRTCYEIRSALVHGSGRVPAPEEVDVRAASLEIMVGDLLSAPVLGYQEGRELRRCPP